MPSSLRHVRTSFFGSSALGGGRPGDIVHESAGCRVVAPGTFEGRTRQGNRCDLAVAVNCETGEIGESSEASQTADEARASAPFAAVTMLSPVAWARVADLVAQAAHAGA